MLPVALTLAACSGSKLSKGSVFGEAFMKNNFEPEFSESVEEKAYQKFELALGEGNTVVGLHDSHEELLKVQNAEGKIAFYHLGLNKYVTPFNDDENLSVVPAPIDGTANSSIKFFVSKTVVEEKTRCSVVDERGEVVLEGEGSGVVADAKFLDKFERADKEVVEVKLVLGAKIENTRYLYYNIDHSLKESLTYSEYLERKGGYADGGVSLAAYGHKDLREINTPATTSNRKVIYSTKEHKAVASFLVPKNGAAASFRVGDFYVCQEIRTVEDRATDYDFFYPMGNTQNDKKYKVETYRINYTNGSREELSTKYVFGLSAINENNQYFNDKGVYAYQSITNVRLIKDDKTLDPVVYDLFFNDKAEVVADVTGIADDLVNIKNFDGKYVAESGKVYDAQMGELAYINGLQANDDKNRRIFQDGAYEGLANHDGKIVLPAAALDIKATAAETYRADYDKEVAVLKYNEDGSVSTLNTIDKETFTYVDDEFLSTLGKITDKDSKAYPVDLATGNIGAELVDPTDSEIDAHDAPAYAFGGDYVLKGKVYKVEATGAYYFYGHTISTSRAFVESK